MIEPVTGSSSCIRVGPNIKCFRSERSQTANQALVFSGRKGDVFGRFSLVAYPLKDKTAALWKSPFDEAAITEKLGPEVPGALFAYSDTNKIVGLFYSAPEAGGAKSILFNFSLQKEEAYADGNTLGDRDGRLTAIWLESSKMLSPRERAWKNNPSARICQRRRPSFTPRTFLTYVNMSTNKCAVSQAIEQNQMI
jgi:hypothetical protein